MMGFKVHASIRRESFGNGFRKQWWDLKEMKHEHNGQIYFRFRKQWWDLKLFQVATHLQIYFRFRKQWWDLKLKIRNIKIGDTLVLENNDGI